MHIQLPEDLRRIQQMRVLNNLIQVPRQQRDVQDERNPVAVDEEEEGQEAVYCCLWDDVGV